MIQVCGVYNKVMAKKAEKKDWVKIGAVIRDIRESLGLTQAEMAEKLNISQNALSRYERGEHSPANILPIIEKVLGVPEAYIKAKAGVYSPQDLVTALEAIKREPVVYDVSEVHQRELYIIPVITRVGAGGTVITENYILYDGRVPKAVRAFIVDGDSMEPTIPQNATVLINTDEKEPIEGKIYLLAKADGGNASALLLRRLKKINGQWHMLPDNPHYPVKQLTPEWIIVGRAVEIVEIRKIRL